MASAIIEDVLLMLEKRLTTTSWSQYHFIIIFPQYMLFVWLRRSLKTGARLALRGDVSLALRGDIRLVLRQMLG